MDELLVFVMSLLQNNTSWSFNDADGLRKGLHPSWNLRDETGNRSRGVERDGV